MAREPGRTTAPPAGRGTGLSRRQRSDAQRNVASLVQAAISQAGDGGGVDAPAKEITDLAGVGVGTLYRHFPRRSDLIIAVLQHEIDECVAAAEELGAALSPWDALVGWTGRFTDFVGTKRGLAAALHSGDPAYDDLPQHLLDRLEPALHTLLARAVDGGYARGDVIGPWPLRAALMWFARRSWVVPWADIATIGARHITLTIDRHQLQRIKQDQH